MTADRRDARAGAGNRRDGIQARYGTDAIRICLDRPPVNALTVDMLRCLGAILAAAPEDPRPVLLTGASGIFSAGFDIKQPAPDQLTIDTAAHRVLAAAQERTEERERRMVKLTVWAVAMAAMALAATAGTIIVALSAS